MSQTFKTTYIISWKRCTELQASAKDLGWFLCVFWQEYWHSPLQMGARISVFAVDLTGKSEAQMFLSIVWIQSSMW